MAQGPQGRGRFVLKQLVTLFEAHVQVYCLGRSRSGRAAVAFDPHPRLFLMEGRNDFARQRRLYIHQPFFGRARFADHHAVEACLDDLALGGDAVFELPGLGSNALLSLSNRASSRTTC